VTELLPIFEETAAALGFRPEVADLEPPADPPSAKRYRRPWLAEESYDATQVLPVVEL
jgi:hypothetical protein